MPYPYAEASNSTPWKCTGEVKYAACKTDGYSVASGHLWRASSRGLCLITAVEATVETPHGKVRATP